MSEEPQSQELYEKKTERLEGVDFFGMVKGKKKLYVVKFNFEEKPYPDNVYVESLSFDIEGPDNIGVVKAEIGFNYEMQSGAVTVWAEITDWPAGLSFVTAVVGERFV